MSIQHANRGVVKKDLQLYYNREYNGSFLGEATMNFFTIPAYTLQKEGNHATSFATSTSSGVPDLVVSGNKQVYYVSEYYTLVATGAWVAESNRLIIYPKSANYAPSGTYRISFYARSLSGNTNLGFAFYGNSINNTATLTSKWQRFSANSTHGGAMIIEFGNLNAGSMVCQIACIQVEAKSYATPFTVPVLWTPNLVNVTSTSGHTTMTKNTADQWLTARVYSSEGYNEPCYVSFKANNTNKSFMIALNTNPVLKGIQYATLDYAWYPASNGQSYIYESGGGGFVEIAYTTSTLFEIIYDGVNINYYTDGALRRSVARSGSGPLYLDSDFYHLNAQIVNLSFGPLSQINRFSNYVIGGGGLKDISGNNVNSNLTNVAFDSTGYIFNGSSNYIDLGSDVIFKTSGGWSVSSWFNLTQVNSGNLYNFIGASAITYNSWFWTVYQSNLALWNMSPGGWYYGSTTILANTWYNAVLVCSYDGTRYQMYLNGIAEGGTHATYTWNADYSGLKIGYIGRGDSSNGRYFYGKYPNFQVYNKELTAAEVLQNFNATRTTYGL